MKPLHIVATLQSAIADRSKRLMLDSLCMAAVAMRDGLKPLPPQHRGPTDLPIPIAKSDCGRIFLASQGFARDEAHEHRWKNRRFPLAEAQMLAEPKFRRINLQGGPCRSYRIPMDTVHLEDGEIHWWAVADADALEELLVGWVPYLGHRRAVGYGKVVHWHIEECEPWDGFPVLQNGRPTRALPTDWPGLTEDSEHAMANLLPPYWRRSEEELCAVPAWV